MDEIDNATIVQLEAIETDIKKDPLISEIKQISELLPEYQNADLPGFVPGIVYLDKNYSFRKVRRDGNCFYRAFLFSYLERIYNLLEKQDNNGKIELDRLTSVIVASKQNLIEIGFSEIAFEFFYDVRLFSEIII